MRIVDRINCLNWPGYQEDLDKDGFAKISNILSENECETIARLYEGPEKQFRSTISMKRYGFGEGEYKYFKYPLPAIIEELRTEFYSHLSPIANEWTRRFGDASFWPKEHKDLTEMCRENGQARPTPLLLRYSENDYNCLHKDIYGDIHFPFQVIVQLSLPGVDFEGGELVLVENRPRMQSRPCVITLNQGDAVVIPVRDRPIMGVRGWRRTTMRHGVSKVTRGLRFALGLIFHDAA